MVRTVDLHLGEYGFVPRLKQLYDKRGGGNYRTPLEVIPGAARVTQIKVLGVTISADLSMTLHLDKTLVRCAASMVALSSGVVVGHTGHTPYDHYLFLQKSV